MKQISDGTVYYFLKKKYDGEVVAQAYAQSLYAKFFILHSNFCFLLIDSCEVGNHFVVMYSD